MMGKLLYEASQWITRFIQVNITWIIFIIAGLGVFGFMPATIALFTVTRHWAQKDFEVPIWKTFKTVFKQEFFRSNLIGLIFALIGLFLYVDLRIADEMQGMFALILYFFIIFLFILYINAFVHFFPIYVHYQYSYRNYIKQSFIISMISPLSTFILVVGLFFIGFFIKNLPGLIPFVSGVLPAYWIITVCLQRFNRLEQSVNLNISKV